MSRFANWLNRFLDSNAQDDRDRWVALAFFCVAAVVYMPGTGWGLPEGNGPGKFQSWAGDEVGALGPIMELRAWVLREGLGNPQYPLFHYFVVALFQAPYLLLQLLTHNLLNPHVGYPYGFADPVGGVQTLALIARGVSVLAGAGTAVVCYFTAKTLWGRAAGAVASIFQILIYPMFYYARMSNTDVPGLFWASLVLLLSARVLRSGLPVARAGWMGLFAALAIGTKDQNYAILLLPALALLPIHFRTLQEKGQADLWRRWRAPLAGLLVSVSVYALASGFVFNPGKFFHHLSFITGKGGSYFTYAATPTGYGALGLRSLQLLVDAVNWPVFLSGCVGIFLCLRQDRRLLTLLLPFPGLFLFGLAPIRNVFMRFLLVWGFVMVCFAGHAVSAGLRSTRREWRVVAMLVLLGGSGLALLRDADFTYLLLHGGSRAEAAEWLAQHAREGDRVEYFGPKQRIAFMPRLKAGPIWLHSAVGPQPGQGRLQGDFVFILGARDQSSAGLPLGRSGCPGWVYAGLKESSLGYELAATIEAASLFSHPRFGVNPQIEIFARRDRAREIKRIQLGEPVGELPGASPPK